VINTNDSWYQQMIDLSPAGVAAAPELLEVWGPVHYHMYNLPYRFYGEPPGEVLIAGGGSGNDAAAAVRNGAGSVTVVEIDPLIVALGREKHFEAPYKSDRVNVVVNDARNFVQNATKRYDLIVFSILDSHTTNSSYTNIRIDNYVYTLEAMRAARKLLEPDGLFVMSFSSERPWFAQRLKDVVTKGFGKAPMMVHKDNFFFVVSPGDRVERTLASDSELRQFVREHPTLRFAPASPITDDWPYLYQQDRGVPVIVWMLSIVLVLICWMAFRGLRQPSSQGIQWHFFFLGAAFMLLEVQVISKVALLFGTTWLVNSIVITTLLAFILLANVTAARFASPPKWLAYGGLFASLALSYFVPTNALFFDSLVMRGTVATLLYCSPVFFAGLIFISSFQAIGFRAEAFGSNLLGSLVGGLLDSMSYAIGINALVIVAAFLYLISMLMMRQSLQSVPATEPAISRA
jgi:SAM-dependent methyltransferase